MSFTVIGFHHVTFLVSDLDRAATFYETALCLRRKPRPNFSSRGIWYDVAGLELHLIETTTVPECHEGHPAMEVSDLRAAVEACIAAGGTLQQDQFLREHDGSYSAFIRDPDGNLLELTNHAAPR
ncbi:MAG: VOC family protein [Cytophagales bacterium]|nr:VOC family protein [Armatimonadota bacterium]